MIEVNADMPLDAIERRLMKFWTWNGDTPAPCFSHWTSRGTFMIRACTPGQPTINEVLFNGSRLGFGLYPISDARNLADGAYNKELGFPASEVGVPAFLEEWNNL